jgi:hypothetical protein
VDHAVGGEERLEERRIVELLRANPGFWDIELVNSSELRHQRFGRSFRTMRVADNSKFLGSLAPEKAAMLGGFCNKDHCGDGNINLAMHMYRQRSNSASKF